MTEYCAVIGHALNRAAQQTTVKEVTRPLPSLAEWGVATQEYCTVIGPTLNRVAQQTAVKEVSKPLPSLVEQGVAT